ncbi:MAG: sigma-54-dependent Fis family transcriptional regulator [Planctomycetes bacterium]|nr:sigma-54-dependent Fis family transcriptional regulator [Planctomycetota bacterium]
MPVLLVIDDDPIIRKAFSFIFKKSDVVLETAATAGEGLEKVAQHKPATIILDIHLPDLPGLEAFRRIREVDARIPIIFITGQGTTDTAIEAMKLGAYEYLLKEGLLMPAETAKLRELVARAFEVNRLMNVPTLVREGEAAAAAGDVLVGRGAAMQTVYKAIGRVASQDVTVLIVGESGTGKELVARAIYQHSRRSQGPFLTINCAAIPETLLESELFGHEKGAFTGADRKRIGKFEQCNGGTLFLDEVGDMTPLTQTKVLRVLQEQRFERVGGNEVIQTNVRLIAATNRDLPQLVAAGQFRNDLFYRLSVYTITLPPLRERLEDLPLLVEHFRQRFSRELGKEVTQVAPETLEALRRHSWPGNIRELQSVLKQALLQATGPVLVPDFLPAAFHPSVQVPQPEPAEADPSDWDAFLTERLQEGSSNLYAEALAYLDRVLLPRVLRHTKGSQAKAAKILGITRARLRGKLRGLGITPDSTLEPKEEQE